jgi:segregation and condensation protein A
MENSGAALPPVELASFSGPLDLLLHLIRVNEVSISDIPIVEITQQYTEYLALMEEMDLDLAAEYIYLAAVLIHIKSRSLLPRDPSDPEGEDPRRELVERLLEYEKFKRAAETLHETDSLRAGLWPRPDGEAPPGGEAPTLEVSLIDLVGAFRQALDRYRLAHPAAIEIPKLRFSLRDKMIEILERLNDGPLPLLELFATFRYRAEAITAFLATLELARLGALRVFQPAPFHEIHVSRTEVDIDTERIRDDYRD